MCAGYIPEDMAGIFIVAMFIIPKQNKKQKKLQQLNLYGHCPHMFILQNTAQKRKINE